mmetsp:Transcript_28013/g.58349  ORF Transcript_28013/g.58349 Transcript_28013/m.58349 type:complete len:89 (+) Transcript_28013:4315-4581(+)|eukprot:CAMPEP_0172203548 /NCGR_PEP_ID=MMETSP1050-20130122/31352_1 /TAXON_ID=233186 /ORGANISM="Cryptomonas curvata, Strain CCAP979/52" /LENGTH=88 /DNA_ID=CAMNT_0012881789 /DNA_START=692 /DNA_END=958 /DNA_ORIENTATION=-
MEVCLHPRTREVLVDQNTKAEIKVLKEQIDLMWFPQQNAMALSRRPKTADEVLLEQVSQLQMRSAVFENDLSRRREALAGQEALSFSV